MASAPKILETSPSVIQAEWIAAFEQTLGRALNPAQTETLLANAAAYREVLLRETLRDAILQNLVAFSRAPMLDFLGDLVGVVRLDATPATCLIEFSLSPTHTGVTIPADTGVRSADGGAVFYTEEDLVVDIGTFTGTVLAVCDGDGVSGNGYSVGAINAIQTPILDVLSATNTTVSGGGAEVEGDDRLRERIKMGPSAFSTAGSRKSYEFWALSAHPDIVDVHAISQSAGFVDVYILTGSGTSTPLGVILAVENVLTDDKVRPLTDQVVVQPVDEVTYGIGLNLTLFASYTESDVLAACTTALNEITAAARKEIRKNITISAIIAAAMVDGVYSVAVVTPGADVVCAIGEVAFCTGVSLTVVATV